MFSTKIKLIVELSVVVIIVFILPSFQIWFKDQFIFFSAHAVGLPEASANKQMIWVLSQLFKTEENPHC